MSIKDLPSVCAQHVNNPNRNNPTKCRTNFSMLSYVTVRPATTSLRQLIGDGFCNNQIPPSRCWIQSFNIIALSSRKPASKLILYYSRKLACSTRIRQLWLDTTNRKCADTIGNKHEGHWTGNNTSMRKTGHWSQAARTSETGLRSLALDHAGACATGVGGEGRLVLVYSNHLPLTTTGNVRVSFTYLQRWVVVFRALLEEIRTGLWINCAVHNIPDKSGASYGKFLSREACVEENGENSWENTKRKHNFN